MGLRRSSTDTPHVLNPAKILKLRIAGNNCRIPKSQASYSRMLPKTYRLGRTEGRGGSEVWALLTCDVANNRRHVAYIHVYPLKHGCVKQAI